jgi:hypothetical protein
MIENHVLKQIRPSLGYGHDGILVFLPIGNEGNIYMLDWL